MLLNQMRTGVYPMPLLRAVLLRHLQVIIHSEAIRSGSLYGGSNNPV
jgi:hypothetical protein